MRITIPGCFALLVLLPATSLVEARSLTFEERVAAQRAIEQVYWRHRIWPRENPGAKPSLSETLPEEALRKKVEHYLEQSRALGAEDLQAELERMSRNTRDPGMLRELFTALGEDPYLIAETLARQTLAERDPKTEQSATADPFTLRAPGGGCIDDTWSPTRASALPETHNGHSAVWTGSEMIVWGGYTLPSGTTVNTGGRYDPATDVWRPISVGPNVPGPRQFHTAIWTGSEMIVWGGADNTGGRYDPATDTWQPVSTTGAPSARNRHTAVWAGNRMIVWGGNSGSYVNTGGVYDPSSDSWSPTSTGSNVPAPRALHTAVWTGSEMIVWGGQVDIGGPTSTGGRYDPVADTWLPTSTGANVPDGRNSHTAIWTGTRMIVWGGTALLGTTNTGGVYDPVANSWITTSTGANAPSPRYWHTALWTGSRMLVFGGSGSSTTYVGGRYDPLLNTWAASAMESSNFQERYLHTAVWTGSEMLVWGGSVSSQLPLGQRYNPVTNSWHSMSQDRGGIPEGRSRQTAVWTGTEMLVWGGTNGSPSYVERYVPATDSWTRSSTGFFDPGVDTLNATSVWTGTEMIVWGGQIFDNVYSGGGYRYDPAPDSWSTVATTDAPVARAGHVAVWTGTRMVVWGGQNGNGVLNTGGRYDPLADTWLATSTAAGVPSARTAFSGVWTGSEMIVWGGSGTGGTRFNTGGRYDPHSDTWIATPTGTNTPSARYGHSAVWTGSEMIVWGGYVPPTTSTGARYRPSTETWTPTSMDGVPSPRQDHTAVWTGREMIFWGGRYDPEADTWRLTSEGPYQPYPRSRPSVFWTGQELIVWGGGDSSTGALYCAASCPLAAPSGVPLVRESGSGGPVHLTWLPVEGATRYDVVKGGLLALLGTHGDFATSTCFADDLTYAGVDDAGVPDAGDAIWYLIRAANCVGPGSYDGGSARQVESRDAEIAASALACP